MKHINNMMQEIQSFFKPLSTMNDLLTFVEQYSNRVAFKEENASITYAEMLKKIGKVRNKIFKANNKKQIKVILIAENTIEFVINFLAVTSLNNIAVLLSPDTPMDTIKKEYSYFESELLIEPSRLKGTFDRNYFNVIDCDDIDDFEYIDGIKSNATDPCIMLLTSGTTGSGKGVLISHEAVQYQLYGSALTMKNPLYLKIFTILPFFHVFGISAMLISIHSGSETFLCNNKANIFKNIVSFPFQLSAMTPTLLNVLIDFRVASNIDIFRTTERIVVGGEKLNNELIEKCKKFNIPICNGYGFTESFGPTALESNVEANSNSVGYFLYGIDARIVNDELQVKTPGKMLGYYKEDNSKYFTEDGFFKTGDIGEFDKDGKLHLKGRISDLYKINGHRINLFSLEKEYINYLNTELAIKISEINKTNCIILFIVSSKTEVEIREILTLKLPLYLIPNKIVYLDKLPLLQNGKIDRLSLKF